MSGKEEARRQDAAERVWLGAATGNRPTSVEAEAMQRRGEPACHAWQVPEGSPPPHLDAVGILRKWQAGACAICAATQSRLLVDHCHESGLIRGLLCTGCNTAEALAGAEVYETYRRRPPAAMLGIEADYGDPWIAYRRDTLNGQDPDERNAAHVDAAEAVFADVVPKYLASGLAASTQEEEK